MAGPRITLIRPPILSDPNIWYAPQWNAWYQRNPHYWQTFEQKYPYWRGHRVGQRYDENFYNKYHRGQGEGWNQGFHGVRPPDAHRPRTVRATAASRSWRAVPGSPPARDIPSAGADRSGRASGSAYRSCVRPAQPTGPERASGPQPTGPAVRPAQPTGPESVRLSPPVRPASGSAHRSRVRPAQPTGPAVRPAQPAGPSVRPAQPAGPGVRPAQPTGPSVRPAQPTGTGAPAPGERKPQKPARVKKNRSSSSPTGASSQIAPPGRSGIILPFCIA